MTNISEAMARGWQFHQAGDMVQAEQVYRQVLDEDPNHIDALYLLGAALQSRGQLDEAEKVYQRVLQIKPDHAPIYHNLGVLASTRGKLDEAIDRYRHSIQLQPNSPDAHFSLGIDLAALGRLDEAIASIQESLRLRPYHVEGYMTLKQLRARKEQATAAGGLPGAWVQPVNAGAYKQAGYAFYQQGRYAEAVANFEQAVRLAPDDADAYNNLGIVLRLEGRAEEAIASYQQALCSDPNYAGVYNNLGISLMEQGRLDEAVGCYRQALRIRPDYVEAYNNLGNVQRGKGKLEEAAASYREALRCRPDYAEAHNNLGVTLMDLGRKDESAASLREAIRLKPDYVAAHHNLGNTLKGLGKYAEAAASYRQVLRWQPDNEEARYFYTVLSGAAVPETAPGSYIAKLFDDYAEKFDEQLVKQLDYHAPEVLRQAVADLSVKGNLTILDLGCGTGLCGKFFRDLADHITGVDLSTAMLAKARQRGVYDGLVQSDLTQYLFSTQKQFDLVVSADVFIYVGNLARVFEGARRVLRPGGRFAFSVEANDGEAIAVRTSGRFAHSLSYLRDLANKHGLIEQSVKDIVLRKESADDIKGYVLIYQLPH